MKWVLLFAFVTLVTRAACMTNRELYQMLSKSNADRDDKELAVDGSVEEYDNAIELPGDLDDVIELPGDLDDELDEEYLLFRLLGAVARNDGTIRQQVDEANMAQDDLGGASCSRGKCCVKVKLWFFKLNACVSIQAVDSKTIKLTANILHFSFSKTFKLRDPPSLCHQIGPAKACIKLYNVNVQRLGACFRIELNLKLGWVKKSFNVIIGCIYLRRTSEDELRELADIWGASITSD